MPAPDWVFMHCHQAGMKLSVGQPGQHPSVNRADGQRLADRKNDNHLTEPAMDRATSAAFVDALRNYEISQSA